MKIKIPVLFVLLFLLIISPVMSATYTAGEKNSLINISSCEGDITIKTEPSDNIMFFDCEKTSYIGVWKCDCSETKNIFFNSTVVSKKEYYIRVQYYLEYKNYAIDDNRTTPTKNEIFNDEYSRIKRFDNITILPKEKKKFQWNINTEQKNVMLVVIVGFILIIGVVLNIIKRKQKKNSDDDNDDLNYIYE